MEIRTVWALVDDEEFIVLVRTTKVEVEEILGRLSAHAAMQATDDDGHKVEPRRTVSSKQMREVVIKRRGANVKTKDSKLRVGSERKQTTGRGDQISAGFQNGTGGECFTLPNVKSRGGSTPTPNVNAPTDEQAEEDLLNQLYATLVGILGRENALRFILAHMVKAEAENEIAKIRG